MKTHDRRIYAIQVVTALPEVHVAKRETVM